MRDIQPHCPYGPLDQPARTGPSPAAQLEHALAREGVEEVEIVLCPPLGAPEPPGPPQQVLMLLLVGVSLGVPPGPGGRRTGSPVDRDSARTTLD